MREVIERPDYHTQEAFTELVGALADGVEAAATLLQGLGVDIEKLKGAVYVWALAEAGLD